jgi:DNA-binding IclR family transcriptional regulator
MQDPPLDSEQQLEPPYDALMSSLDRRGYPQSARRVVTRLFLAEVDTSGPLSQRGLAHKTGLDVATVRAQLGTLEADGYVTHRRNSNDPREKLYRLVSLDESTV